MRYRERFETGPPILNLGDAQADRLMRLALERGTRMDELEEFGKLQPPPDVIQ